MNTNEILGTAGSAIDPLIDGINEINGTISSPLWTDVGLFWVGVVTVFVTFISAIASLLLVTLNLKTVKAANLQIKESKANRAQNKNLDLYPRRKEILESVQNGQWRDVPDLTTDIELLLPSCLNVYNAYKNIQFELSKWEYVKDSLEQFATELGTISESDLQTARVLLEMATNEEVLSGEVSPFQGFTGRVFNPDTAKEEVYVWDEAAEHVSTYSNKLRDAYTELLQSIKNEIRLTLGLSSN